MTQLELQQTLYCKTKQGNVSTYRMLICQNGNHWLVKRYHATKLGGKEQEDIITVKEGVNIGKNNETTVYQQAIREATTIYNKLFDKGYKLEIPTEKSDASGNVKPMLAHKFDIEKHEKLFPAFVQPKLDGARCLMSWQGDEVVLTSRTGKIFNLPHISKWGKNNLPKNMVYDGELYIHDIPFQTLMSAIKKANLNTPDIMFRCYDMIHLEKRDMPFQDRWDIIKAFYLTMDNRVPNPFSLVETNALFELDHAKEKFAEYIAAGYEGMMIRDKEGIYEAGDRSYSLLKYKEFEDEDFAVVDIVEATGRDAGTAVFVVMNEDGNTFNVRPMGTFEQRAEYWEYRNDYKDKLLTVQFQGKSKDGIPRFPVGKAVRDYE